jgi:HK97 family phage prohead protease
MLTFNSRSLTFDKGSLTFADVAVTGFAVDTEARTITGLALPYNRVGTRAGMRFRFAPGALSWNGDVTRIKLLRGHDATMAIGYAETIEETAEGLRVRFKVARGPAGDEALQLAEDRVLDGLSVGVDFSDRDVDRDPADASVMLIRRAELREVSLTPLPSFDDARVSTVTAERGTGTTPEPAKTVSPVRVTDRPTAPPWEGLAQPLMPTQTVTTALLTAAREGRSARFTTDDQSAAQQFATVTTTNVGVPAQPVNRPVREPRRLAVAAGLPVTPVDGVSSATYPVFGAGSAEVTAEGAAKQEYAAITNDSAVPQMINVWTDFTRQISLSTPAFEARLRSQLAKLVAIREDKLLIATALSKTLPTFAKTAGVARADALMQAAATILAATGAEPNVAVVNTADVPGIFTGSFGQGGESPESGLRLTVKGMLVYPSADIVSGTALVGAWPAGASLVQGLPPTYLVDAVSGIKNNKITVLLEEAVQLAIDDLSAFVKITTFTN